MFAPIQYASALDLKAQQWQLVSFPRLPQDATLENVFGDAASNGTLTSVWTFNNNSKQWQSWPSQAGLATSNLTQLTLGQGYWIKTETDLTLDLVDATQAVGEMVLYPGWNLIGLSVDQDMGHEQALAGVPFLELWKYDSHQNKFLSVQKSSGSQIILKEEFSQIEAGLGLWVYMAEQSTLLPAMGTLLPPDIDMEPLLNLSQYGVETPWDNYQIGADIDWDDDGYFDFPNTQHTLAFGDFLNRQRLSITNEGNGVLSWQATIEPAVDWLLFEAFDTDGNPVLTNFAVGNVSNSSGELVLVANRTGMAPASGYNTQIVLRANGSLQEKRIDVNLAVADVVGDYEMTVRLDEVNGKQADLHNPKYFLSFARDGEGVKAFLDEERSLLIPQITYLSGDYIADPESHFQVLGQLYLPQGHAHNPYQSDIRREFTVIGQRSDGNDGLSPLDLKGTYSENIYGIFADPVQLKGEFVAIRLSPTPKKKDQTISDIISGEILPEATSEFEVNITDRYSITDLKTALSIDHPQPEALTITLTGPEWTDNYGNAQRSSVVLHDNQNRSLKDVRFDDYDPAIDSLDSFNGQFSFGIWTLKITNSSTNIGDLKAWTVDVSGAKVYKLSGALNDAGIGIQISGCGVVKTVQTDHFGNFEFDGLIPCDYELKVLQLGYEITSTNVRIIGCMQGDDCNTTSHFTETLSADQLANLQPQLLSSNGVMKVIAAPVTGQLPVTFQAVDITNYNQLEVQLISRKWELYKTVNSWGAINNQGYLIDVESMGGQVPPGNNYFSYSEDFSQWNPGSRVTLSKADITDPRGGYNATMAKVNSSGVASVFTSNNIGQGGFAVTKDDYITFSTFLKANTSSEASVRFHGDSGLMAQTVLDFNSGVIDGNQEQSSHVQVLANGWFRVSVTVKAQNNEANFHVELLLANNGSVSNTQAETSFYVFGPQLERHDHAVNMLSITTDDTTIYIPHENLPGYIVTGFEHGVRDANNQQDVLIATSTTGLTGSWHYELQNKQELAGIYFIKLISDVRNPENQNEQRVYQTGYLSAHIGNNSDVYLGAYGTYGAAGQAGIKAMDMATYDLDRSPLISDSGSQGTEDSDGFKAQDIEGDEYQTNALNDVNENPPGVYSLTPNGIDAPTGNLNQHYRMFISAGQLYQGGSMYSGSVRMDVGIQSQEQSEWWKLKSYPG